MSLDTRLTRLLGIRYPIIQAGMSWASSCAALPAAVSNGGGLGVIAAGPMRLADLAQTLREMRELTDKPFAVNIPLYRKGADEVLDLLVAERVPVIIASQGSPKAHLQRFKAYGATWLHVVAFVDHARKAAAAGVDGLVVVGSEAGGHPPANEVSTLVNVRRVLQEVDCPLVAGGGVADGHGIAALLALGADAVQLGTRFMLSEEAFLHPAYKQKVLEADIGDTVLVGRGALPVRSVRNAFTERVAQAERDGLPQTAPEAYAALLASASLKQASFDGDVSNGKVEAGQSAGLIHQLLPASAIMQSLIEELEQALARLRAMQP
ncbi:2-nitropropane dioxygenase [Pseudomonas sp. WS 5106]|jgi:enoyl-[acyl-carrier protein] reductase II|uniref:2-nitropropane dioxygenase n=1 Tax=Pseudomonas cremoris TaxID=2724178 RepID=A0A7X1AJH9_9PSED|nr:nitronate monooxygenase [Pseudomonas cremoris]MBC2379782.1 2-nitropropane dioxygenase [Pseudomonas cremoris]MBC2404613.1 2-nitropropane dioxygenase [Pseudomonas cremoris]